MIADRGRLGRASAGSGVLVAVVATATIALLLPASATAGPSCELGRDGRLVVEAQRGLKRFVSVVRAAAGSEAIVVDTDAGPIGCAGPPASVANVDRVLISGPAGAKSVVAVNLRNGPLAPGSGSEPRAPEIEIRTRLGNRFDIVFIVGRGASTPGGADDRIQLGSPKPGVGLANLNVPGDGPDPDPDLRMLGSERTILIGGAGADRVEGSGGKGTGAPFRAGELWLFGSSGDDHLIGGRRGDLISGNSGSDLLEGGRGRDLLVGGSSIDRFFAGAGGDFIRSRDGDRERLDCGAGSRDVVQRDRSDRLAGNCEFATVSSSGASASATATADFPRAVFGETRRFLAPPR